MKIKVSQRGFTRAELLIVLVVVAMFLVIINWPSTGVFDYYKTKETTRVATAFEESINAIHKQWSAEGEEKDSVEFNGLLVEVTANGWAKQLNSNLAGCMAVWRSVLQDSPELAIYDKENHAEAWSVGGGPNVCYFINQEGDPFDEDETPYFRYSNEAGQVTHYNM